MTTPHTPRTPVRRARTATVSLALAAVLAGGSVASAAPAFAKPAHAGKGAHAVAGEKPGKPEKGEKPGKPDKADKDARKLARTVAQLERRLANVVKESRLVGLSDADVAAVSANVESDRASLAGYTSWKELKALRVSNHVVAVNFLRQAGELTVALADAAALEVDVTEAEALVVEAVAALHTVTASSDRAVLRDAKGALSEAEELLEAALEALEEVELEEPVTEEDVVEEDVVEDVEEPALP